MIGPGDVVATKRRQYRVHRVLDDGRVQAIGNDPGVGRLLRHATMVRTHQLDQAFRALADAERRIAGGREDMARSALNYALAALTSARTRGDDDPEAIRAAERRWLSLSRKAA